MEGKAVGCRISGATDIADTEEGKEISEIWFGLIDHFKGGSEFIIDLNRKVV